VLLVEDSPLNREVVHSILVRLGLDVELAENGAEALATLARSRFDLVLMDCMMPGLDGYAATSELRLRESAGSGPRTPVVALTASAMAGDRERCLAAGMDDYLSKPFLPQELAAVLARWLPERGRGGVA
jgi:CheY-like chemotaxis protein